MRLAPDARVPTGLPRLQRLDQVADLIRVSPARLRRIAEHAGRYHRPFDIASKNGAWRHVDQPIGPLKEIQRSLHRLWLGSIELPSEVVGGVSGRSRLDNARPHVAQSVVVTIDLRNYYGAVEHRRVHGVFSEVLGLDSDAARVLTKLTTFHGHVTLGAPTSLALATLSIMSPFEEIRSRALDFDLRWTMYVDDLTLSGRNARAAIDPVVAAIHRHGHSVPRRKVRVMSAESAQITTGVQVNGRVSLPRPFRRAIVDSMRELSRGPIVFEHQLRRLRGQIASAAAICPRTGARLQALCDELLGTSSVVASSESSNKPQLARRACRGLSAHRHRRKRPATLERGFERN